MPSGSVLHRVMCAGYQEGYLNTAIPCSEEGKSFCSNCKLVKYCSKDHQVSHWPEHKRHCKHPLRNVKWIPEWVATKSTPAFMSTARGPTITPFGGQHYIWGNVPAMDCLNLSYNEGAKANHENFTLCFAASGDLRNAISTVNHLPSDYQGQCKILLNDRDPFIFARNAIILLLLLDPTGSIEDAAETATNVTYSVRLPPRDAGKVNEIALQILSHTMSSRNSDTAVFPIQGGGSVEMRAANDILAVLYHLSQSNYTVDDARQALLNARMHPSRQDYRDRQYDALKPSHRVAADHFWRNGIALPFGAHDEHFTEPNRTMFTPAGDYLLRDSSDPLAAWNMQEMIESGLRHGASDQDIYGCLFFYVKEQYAEFSRRIRDFKVEITVTAMDASVLASMIRTNQFDSFPPGCFDRIETSNIADQTYVGIATVLSDWGPLLNKLNKHATLLTHFMNWIMIQRDGTTLGASGAAQARATEGAMKFFELMKYPEILFNRYHPLALRADQHKNMFYDNDVPFKQYLKTLKVDSYCVSAGVIRKKRSTIIPKRVGSSLEAPNEPMPNLTKEEFYALGVLQGSIWVDRYAEFQVVTE